MDKELGLFDIINDISNQTDQVYDIYKETGYLPKVYSQYMVNKAFGNYMDTVLLANEANICPSAIPDYAHFLLMRGMIRKRKRFAKWFKDSTPEFVEYIARYMGWSMREAKQNVKNIPQDTITKLMKEYKQLWKTK